MGFPVDPTIFDYGEEEQKTQSPLPQPINPDIFDYGQQQVDPSIFDYGPSQQVDPAMFDYGEQQLQPEAEKAESVGALPAISGKLETMGRGPGDILMRAVSLPIRLLFPEADQAYQDLMKAEETRRIELQKQFSQLPWYTKLGTEVIADTPELMWAGGLAGKITKPLAIVGETALKKVGTSLLKRGARGATMSLVFDIMKDKEVEPDQALIFAGLDIATGFGGDLFKALSDKRMKKILDRSENSGDLMRNLSEETPEAITARQALSDNNIPILDVNPSEVTTPGGLIISRTQAAEAGIPIKNIAEAAKDKVTQKALDAFALHAAQNPELYTAENIAKKIFEKRGKDFTDLHLKNKMRQVDNVMKGKYQGLKEDTISEIKEALGDIFREGGLSAETIQAGKELETAASMLIRKWRKPTPAQYIRPQDAYLHALGGYDIAKGGIEAKLDMELAFRKASNMLDALGKEIKKVEGVKFGIGGKKVMEDWWNMLDKFETAADAGLTGKRAQIFQELRGFTREMLNRVNVVRLENGLKPIEGIEAYMHHMFDAIGRSRIDLKHIKPEEMLYWLGKNPPRKVFNPTEFVRVGETRNLIKDPIASLKRMAAFDLREMYLTKPNLLFREVMDKYGKFMPHDTRKWIEGFHSEVIMGGRTASDQAMVRLFEKGEGTKVFDWFFKGKSGEEAMFQTMRAIRRGLHLGALPFRLKLALRNRLQVAHIHSLYGSRAFGQAMLPSSPEVKELIKGTRFYKTSMGYFSEAMPQGALPKLARIGFTPYGKVHISNVYRSMKAAYHATMPWIEKRKFARLGFADPKRTYTEAKGFLYPSEKVKLINEMEHAANVTQYMYNLVGMPQIYRSELGKTFGSLQSWAMNYFGKFWPEMINRLTKGTSLVNPGCIYPVKARLAVFRHLVGTSAMAHAVKEMTGLDYTRTVAFGVAPAGFNPALNFALGFGKAVQGKWSGNEWMYKSGLNDLKHNGFVFIPYSLAVKDVIQTLDSDEPFGLDYFFYTSDKD